MQDFEKLGVFYLGREYDLARRTATPELLLYDAKDLTTHAVCVGMTGSGKTGLCLALLEEAAIDGVPAIAIDPKGDLGNLLLTFPKLQAGDFQPWIDASEAARKNLSVEALAAETAERWRSGLAEWGQDAARIERFRSAVDVAIYTPGSSAGLPLAVLRSFAAPPAAIVKDEEALGERIAGSTAGLLALVGIEADPIRSREHILISQLLERAWREKRDLDIAGLIRGVQSPPFDRVGVVDVESFFPAKERHELAMQLNNLLASPGFAAWLEGEPLDVGRLLYTSEGRPRLSVVSIAHLSDAERMFFVTILLEEILSWLRTQPGTSSLRAILYMDEIFGYFPPTANPPSKTPMLTLLKQARAYGLGIVLATQNPVDLDYKGLSNTGTWFLGRLQTERDKARVLDGLEGASAARGASLDRAEMDKTLSALGSRVFLMNNVHDDRPVVFESRWCLSYLRGPLTREQIRTLMAPTKEARKSEAESSEKTKDIRAETPEAAVASDSAGGTAAGDQPLIPAEAGECFAPRRSGESAPGNTVYRPTLVGSARLHYVSAKAEIDHWQEVTLIAPLKPELSGDVWEGATELSPEARQFDAQPAAGASFEPVPGAAMQAKSYAQWQKSLAAHLYRSATLKLFAAPSLKETSQPGESESDFRIRLQVRTREERDQQVEKLRAKYTAKLNAIETQMRRANQRVDRETAEYRGQVLQTTVSVGASILGALLGRKLTSQTNIRGAATAARGAGRTAKQHGDIARAEQEIARLREQRTQLDEQFAADVAKIDRASGEIALEPLEISPRKSDIAVRKVKLAWVPVA